MIYTYSMYHLESVHYTISPFLRAISQPVWRPYDNARSWSWNKWTSTGWVRFWIWLRCNGFLWMGMYITSVPSYNSRRCLYLIWSIPNCMNNCTWYRNRVSISGHKHWFIFFKCWQLWCVMSFVIILLFIFEILIDLHSNLATLALVI